MNSPFNKYLLSVFTIAAAMLVMVSCSDDSTSGSDSVESQLDVYTVTDLAANPSSGRPSGEADFTYYNLRNNTEVADSDSTSTNWDIAFSSFNVKINGGVSGPGDGAAIILDVPFEDVTTAPSEGYNVDTDTTQAAGDWYRYTLNGNPPHAVLPIEDKTIVVRTADGGHYAKIKIISYYQGNPDVTTEEFADTDTRPDGGYYTFDYAIQMNGTRELQ